MPKWLRLVISAFILSAWMTVALASGTANADSPPPSDDPTSSESAQKPTSEPDAKPDRPRLFSGLQDRLTKLRDQIQDRRPNRNTVVAADAPKAGQDGAPEGANVEIAAAASTPKPESSSKPRLRLLQLPKTPDNPLRQLRLADVTPKPPATAKAVVPKPLAANIVPDDPPTPRTSPVLGAVDIPQLGRQGTGLVSDVGVVAASVVFTAADTVAQAVGPDLFGGVPYALATALANTAAMASRAVIGAPLDADSPGRFRVTYGVLNGLSFINPTKPPPGANDPTIKVTEDHPIPIILLNGTTATQGTNWSVGAPVLANAGYKVYTFNYGNVTGNPNSPIQATGDIAKSAEELDKEIDRVRKETGAEKVILIGHSQGGGILPAYYINNVDGGAEKVSQVIGIAPSNHGTDVNGLAGLLSIPVVGPLTTALVYAIGPAFAQQLVGSDFQDVVYGEQDTDPRVIYTNIITRNDEIVTPYTQQALEGDNVTNIVLQDRYPGYPAGHLGVVLSPQVWDIVLEELEKNEEANPSLHQDELVA